MNGGVFGLPAGLVANFPGLASGQSLMLLQTLGTGFNQVDFESALAQDNPFLANSPLAQFLIFSTPDAGLGTESSPCSSEKKGDGKTTDVNCK